MIRIIAVLAVMLFWMTTTQAQVVVNEFSASNLESFYDSFGKTEDWIELYNTSTDLVDISGWHISDKENKPTKWAIPAGTTLDANGYLVLYCSGRDTLINDEYHTNFKLAQTKGSDIVLLSDASGTVLEMHEMNLTLVEHSRCRVTDGDSEWRISTTPSFGTTNDGTPQVNGYTTAPSMDLEGGFYEGSQTVQLTNNEPNSTLRYTLDGTNPRANSPEYTDPITVTETTVIKAQAYSNDPMLLPGKMDFNTYFIDEDYSLAVFSVAADDVIDLANGQGELIPIGSIEYFNTDKVREATSFGSLNRHGQDSWVLDHRSLDWISRDEMGYSKSVDAPLFGFSDRDEYQKFMFRNSGDDNYPAINDGVHDGATHIRDEYVQTLAQLGDMKLDNRAVERVVLFLNGQYWGVYGMRDRPVDHDYTDYYYDQGKYEIQYLSTWGITEIEYGGIEAIRDWENLRNFILENDMANAESYQIAEDSINMTSLIDYMLVNLNVVASDWLNYNTGWWRGLNPDGDHKKWGYILWDLDATFDYYINYTGVPNISPDAAPCDLEIIADEMDYFFGPQVTDYGDGPVDEGDGGDGGEDPEVVIDTTLMCNSIINNSSPYPITDTLFQLVVQSDDFCCAVEWDELCQELYDDFSNGGNGGFGGFGEEYIGNVGAHEKLFIKLLDESPEFQQLYYTRYADLMNTVFSCENMNTLLDSMLAVIDPEMPGQIERWGGTLSQWNSNVDDLKEFINQRCTLLDDGAIGCYDDLTETHQITLLTEPDGIGEIDLNSLDIEEFPWSGDYFGGIVNTIKAKVFDEFDAEYEFSHWESTAANEVLPDLTERKATMIINEEGTLTAHFKLKVASNVDDLTSKHAVSVFPNPATNLLNIVYHLETSEKVSVDLLTLSGQTVARIVDGSSHQTAGKHTIQQPLEMVEASGLYIIKITIGDQQSRYRVSIMK